MIESPYVVMPVMQCPPRADFSSYTAIVVSLEVFHLAGEWRIGMTAGSNRHSVATKVSPAADTDHKLQSGVELVHAEFRMAAMLAANRVGIKSRIHQWLTKGFGSRW